MASDEQWFVGVDWATEQHQICVLEGDGKVVGERQVGHSGAGIADLCRWLEELSGGHLASVHAAIEMPHGAVVEMLLERKVQVYAINPKQLDRFRDRFTAAGAKDDRRDARVLADSLRTDRRSFRHLQSPRKHSPRNFQQAHVATDVNSHRRITPPTPNEPTRVASRDRLMAPSIRSLHTRSV